MTDTSEHRGWEIENDYSEHWMDDADYDLAEDAGESGGGAFFVAIILLAILLVGAYGLGKYLELPPLPPVTFKITPPMPLYVPWRTLDPLHACGKLPSCPAGRSCQIGSDCIIRLQ